MRLRPVLACLAAVAIAGCGGSEAEGSWRFVALAVDGDELHIDEPLFLDVTGDAFRASTTCNSLSGHFGGEIIQTAMACIPDDLMVPERHLSEAFRAEPTRDGDLLVFDHHGVRAVYEAFTDPSPADLVSALGDSNLRVDESALPSAQVTGSVPPDFDSLVPVPSPAADVDLYLGALNGNVCIVYTTGTSIDTSCAPPRIADAHSHAVGIPTYAQPILRAALIPDRFASAAAGRPDLGTYGSNLLVVLEGAPAGRHVLTADSGDALLLDIAPAWSDPMAASSTVPGP